MPEFSIMQIKGPRCHSDRSYPDEPERDLSMYLVTVARYFERERYGEVLHDDHRRGLLVFLGVARS